MPVAEIVDWFEVVEARLRTMQPMARAMWVADHPAFCEMRQAMLLRDEPVPEGWPNAQPNAQ
jgi:hypothetical protein